MKKQSAITVLILILMIIFISNCNRPSSTVIAPVPVPTSTPVFTPTTCVPGNVNYSSLNYGTVSGLALPAGDYIITTEAFYLANYTGYAPAGSPTPTPVPVDFNKQIIIGVMITGGCMSDARGLTNITTDCNNVYINITTTNSWCPGEPTCFAIMQPVTGWYVMNKTNLPIVGKYIFVDNCTGTTTTTIGPFAPTPASSPVLYSVSTATPTPVVP